MQDRPKRRSNARKLRGIRAVAQRAGVAVSSVSRAFSPGESVSAETRARIFEAARAVGYIPDAVARSLRRGTTSTIGCVVANIANPTFAQIITGAGQSLQSHGYAMLIANSAEGAQNEVSQLEMLQRHRVDGMLISVVDESNRETRAQLAAIKTAGVILDRDLPGLANFGRVLFDHQAGLTDAVAALAQLGHQRLAFIGGTPSTRPTRERSQAFMKACGKLSITGVTRLGSYADAHGEASAHELLTGTSAPSAIIAGSNQILIGVLRAIRTLALRIPQDVSLVTCDEVPLMDALQPKQAVITRDLLLLGRESAEMLVSMVGGALARTKILPVSFRFGPSCGRPSADASAGDRLAIAQ
jgi:LacI family transcriptional regulator